MNRSYLRLLRRWCTTSLLALVAALSFIFVSATGVLADHVRVFDRAGVLGQSQVQSEAAMLSASADGGLLFGLLIAVPILLIVGIGAFVVVLGLRRRRGGVRYQQPSNQGYPPSYGSGYGQGQGVNPPSYGQGQGVNPPSYGPSYGQGQGVNPWVAGGLGAAGGGFLDPELAELERLKQARGLDPNDSSAHGNQGQGNVINLKLPEEARAALRASLEQALRQNPNAVVYGNQGNALNALNALKLPEEARAALEQALRQNPNAVVYGNQGNALDAFKEAGVHFERAGAHFEQAQAHFGQARGQNPSDASVYVNKGKAFLDLKQYEEALTAFEQALRLDPNNALAYYNKSVALGYLGKRGEAQEASEKARQLGYSG